MKLNKKLEIGMNTVTALRNREGFVRTLDLAPEVGTTVNFLEQIMRNLRNGGIVNVRRGPGGGYQLNKEANITAFSVAQAVGRFTEESVLTGATGQLHKNIEEAFKNTKL